MVGLTALWLPILLSAVFVFVASSIIHMGPFWHKNDFPMSPLQDKMMDALRPLNVPPGEYMIPRPATMADMKTPAFQDKLNKGPVFMMTMLPNGQVGMGGPLIQWFIYCLVVSVFVAYLTGRTVALGTDYLHVYRVAGCTAFLGYALALVQNSIWFKRAWSFTIKGLIDGLIYAGVTGGTFGWLWHTIH